MIHPELVLIELMIHRSVHYMGSLAKALGVNQPLA